MFSGASSQTNWRTANMVGRQRGEGLPPRCLAGRRLGSHQSNPRSFCRGLDQDSSPGCGSRALFRNTKAGSLRNPHGSFRSKPGSPGNGNIHGGLLRRPLCDHVADAGMLPRDTAGMQKLASRVHPARSTFLGAALCFPPTARADALFCAGNSSCFGFGIMTNTRNCPL